MTRVCIARHARTVWSEQRRFTGWEDIPLSPGGVRQTAAIARALEALEFAPDSAFTSTLRRAEQTLSSVLDHLGHVDIPIHRDERLRERSYGALVGLSKETEAPARFGRADLQRWRTRCDAAPPDGETHIGESFRDMETRVLDCWAEVIEPVLLRGQRPLVVVHGVVTRALLKHLLRASFETSGTWELPTGCLTVLELDDTLTVTRVERVHPQTEAAPCPRSTSSW